MSASFVDIPAPEAIAQAVTSFPTEWDKAAIMKHASKFSRGAFATKMWEVVEQSMLESPSTQDPQAGGRAAKSMGLVRSAAPVVAVNGRMFGKPLTGTEIRHGDPA